MPEEQQEPVADAELSAEDAAERDRRNQQTREASERAEFKRRTQVLQRLLPRPSVVDVEAMLRNASEIKDPAEAAVAKEMALLIANDAFKYPVNGGEIRGSSRPVEVFDDTALNNARLEIALEVPQGATQKGSAEFEQAWADMHQSSKLPGLASYGEDEIDEHQLMMEAFDVSLLNIHYSTDTDVYAEHSRTDYGRCGARQQSREEACDASRRLSTARKNLTAENRRGSRGIREINDKLGYFQDLADC